MSFGGAADEGRPDPAMRGRTVRSAFDPVLLGLGEAGEDGEHLVCTLYERRIRRWAVPQTGSIAVVKPSLGAPPAVLQDDSVAVVPPALPSPGAGEDDSLILWFLSLSLTERLAVAQDFVESVALLKNGLRA